MNNFQGLLKVLDFISNMGLRYVLFRIWHLVQIKTGLFKKKFPSNPDFKSFISLDDWKKANIPFFINNKSDLKIENNLSIDLESRFRESIKNNITFFNNETLQLSQETQWSKNPSSGYKYDTTKHWSEIEDLSKEAGDIKFVWEKARFSYLYDIIRYDYHSETDQSHYVLNEIENFIDNNPINLGPQYKCSQEISLRVLNWTYAIYYYKNSIALTSDLFKKIINAIYWQIDHVRKNIHFSRIAVRNNHAITESLMLYLSGLLFPFIPESKKWSELGKKWFEDEINYQIYDDGTFLQYSMNYHRVVVQLLTWGIRLSELHGDRFKKSVYSKAQKSLNFLDNCIDKTTGKLPNYGSNDGALFFKFTDDDYRVYRSQLDDLRMVLQGEATAASESFAWYGLQSYNLITLKQDKVSSFNKGGYYIINEEDDVKTFIRCGSYRDRPAQADNLHLDIWMDGNNYLWDCGSYKYNTEEKYLKHFIGSVGHNTVTINNADQMFKGGRFIWFKWVKYALAQITEDDSYFKFEGEIEAFRHIGKRTHKRNILKAKGVCKWEITDTLDVKNDEVMKQHWHINPEFENYIVFDVHDINGKKIEALREEKWYSSYYGSKQKSIHLIFTSTTSQIKTTIKIS